MALRLIGGDNNSVADQFLRASSRNHLRVRNTTTFLVLTLNTTVSLVSGSTSPFLSPFAAAPPRMGF